MKVDQDRDYWRLLEAAGLLLADMRCILAHPCLDIGLNERECYERTCQDVYSLLPAPLQRVVNEAVTPGNDGVNESAAPEYAHSDEIPF